MGRQNFAWPVTSIDQADYEAFLQWFEQTADILQNQLLLRQLLLALYPKYVYILYQIHLQAVPSPADN